jgi:hypothetical protein
MPTWRSHNLSCHNKIRDELSDLDAPNKATPFPSAVLVCDKPRRIQTCCCTVEPKVVPELQDKPSNVASATKTCRGGILIHGILARGTDCMIDVRITDVVNAKVSSNVPPSKTHSHTVLHPNKRIRNGILNLIESGIHNLLYCIFRLALNDPHSFKSIERLNLDLRA